MKLSEELAIVRNFLILYPTDPKSVLSMAKRLQGLIEQAEQMESGLEKKDGK